LFPNDLYTPLAPPSLKFFEAFLSVSVPLSPSFGLWVSFIVGHDA
jgi:hypothetical protein